ncbi:AOS1 [Sanghuangporus sanghuang]
MLSDPSVVSKTVPLQITEDEAAVYDRQIRLWGLDAQQRMRNATIMIVGLKGVATETAKNIVLAGIGKLIVVDEKDVSEEDLGADFFLREEDVGKKRVDAAKPRIESLNPLVTVETIPSLASLEPGVMQASLEDVDLVCVTDLDRNTMMRINDACRLQNKPFYAAGTYGLTGFIFTDLIDHEYLAPDTSDPKDPGRRVKKTLTYCPLKTALQPYSWEKLNRVQTKELNPAAVFSVLALWEFQARHDGALLTKNDGREIGRIADALFSAAKINKRVLQAIPQDISESLAATAAHEFSPVCAVVGGMLAQDMLKALAGRDPPIANLFVFDGNTGHGSVCRMNMPLP